MYTYVWVAGGKKRKRFGKFCAHFKWTNPKCSNLRIIIKLLLIIIIIIKLSRYGLGYAHNGKAQECDLNCKLVHVEELATYQAF